MSTFNLNKDMLYDIICTHFNKFHLVLFNIKINFMILKHFSFIFLSSLPSLHSTQYSSIFLDHFLTHVFNRGFHYQLELQNQWVRAMSRRVNSVNSKIRGDGVNSSSGIFRNRDTATRKAAGSITRRRRDFTGGEGFCGGSDISDGVCSHA